MSTWTTPEIHYEHRRDYFTVIALITDPNGAVLIADGSLSVLRAGGAAEFEVWSQGTESSRPLMWELSRALHAMGPAPAQGGVDEPRVYSHGVYLLPGEEHLLHLLALSAPADGTGRVPTSLRNATVVLVGMERSRVAHEHAALVSEDMDFDKSLVGLEPVRQQELRATHEKSRMGQRSEIRICPNIGSMAALIPRAISVISARRDHAAIVAAARRAIRTCPADAPAPPRDAVYECLVAFANPKSASLVIIWNTHTGMAPYPEMRAALARCLPGAFARPRVTGAHRPGSDVPVGTDSRAVMKVSGFDVDDPDWMSAFAARKIAFRDQRQAGESAKQGMQSSGFNSLGWYQSFHRFDEDSWGIYIDARALDGAVAAFSSDLSEAGFGSAPDPIAARAVVGMLYRHQSFHARVEAVLTWVELVSGKPRNFPYTRTVCRPPHLTEDCIEAALANFWAWSWVQTESILLQLAANLDSEQSAALNAVVEKWLDMCPPGHRNWRLGQGRAAWRRLASQFVGWRTRAPATGFSLPLEGLLKDPLPFDLRSGDVPLHFVGEGAVARYLQSSPATFNLAMRRELRVALAKVFSYELVSRAGKGHDETWRGSDGRTFNLPRRDPVSRHVFQSFLMHFDLSEADYLERIRHPVAS